MGLLLSFAKSYWPQLAAFVGAVAIGFGLAWNLQGVRLDALEIEFGQYRNEVERNAVAAKRAALDKEKFWLGEIENARINAQSREARLKRDAANAQSAVVGLRNDLGALRDRLAKSPVAACLDTADSLGVLLGQCAEAYRDVSEIADRHASEVQTLIEAWPRQDTTNREAKKK